MIPDFFRTKIMSMYGQAGEVWLSRLPGRLGRLSKLWQFELVQPAGPELSYNLISIVRLKGGRLGVVKSFYDVQDMVHEAKALRLYAGRGMVRLLRQSKRYQAVLLEYLQPGTNLTQVTTDEEAVGIAAGLMKELWRPVGEGVGLKPATSWFEAFDGLYRKFDGTSGPLPKNLVEKASALFDELNADQPERVLLHGDLHHFNILRAGRTEWLAIDPKGIVGERAYEVGAFLRNPLPGLLDRQEGAIKALLSNRITQFAELTGQDAHRIHAWAFYQGVLAAIWPLEGEGGANNDWKYFIKFAELINQVKL